MRIPLLAQPVPFITSADSLLAFLAIGCGDGGERMVYPLIKPDP
jgi:hypothetical protein